MRASVFMAGEALSAAPPDGQLEDADRRARLARLAGTLPPVLPPSAAAPLSLGNPRLDQALAGGLQRDSLHEIRSTESRNAGAATGFAVATLSRLLQQEGRSGIAATETKQEARSGIAATGTKQEARSAGGATGTKKVLWIAETASDDEAGLPYAAGLARFGIPADRLVVARVKKTADVLWVFEEGLRCRGLSAVLAEIRGTPPALDLTASRRLLLRAREHGVMGLMLRQAAAVEPGAAVTRWRVAPRPAGVTDDYPAGIGNPAWRLTLERNRFGTIGTFDVEWNHERGSFADAAHPVPGAAVPADRPPAAREPREIVALAS